MWLGSDLCGFFFFFFFFTESIYLCQEKQKVFILTVWTSWQLWLAQQWASCESHSCKQICCTYEWFKRTCGVEFLVLWICQVKSETCPHTQSIAITTHWEVKRNNINIYCPDAEATTTPQFSFLFFYLCNRRFLSATDHLFTGNIKLGVQYFPKGIVGKNILLLYFYLSSVSILEL